MLAFRFVVSDHRRDVDRLALDYNPRSPMPRERNNGVRAILEAAIKSGDVRKDLDPTISFGSHRRSQHGDQP